MKKIKVGDTVKVISGKDKGKNGEVVAIMFDKNRVVVKGVNIVTKHKKQDGNTKQTGRYKVEAPFDLSNVMLVNPQNGKTTRVRFEIDEKTGKKYRVAVNTNKKID